VAHAQKGEQFGSKVFLSTRGGKPEARQGVDCWKPPEDFAVAGLNAQDGTEHVAGDSKALLCFLEGCLVKTKVLAAIFDDLGG
jgi:hypothetical protein